MTYERTPPVDLRLPWVLVANGSRARLFERDPDNGAMRELSDFLHPGSRMKGHDLERDRPGQAVKGRQAQTEYEPHTLPSDREYQQFARELARHVEAAVNDNRIGRWSLFASNPFLGHLRAALGSGALAALEHHFERDLTSFVGAELERHVSALLAAKSEA